MGIKCTEWRILSWVSLTQHCRWTGGSYPCSEHSIMYRLVTMQSLCCPPETNVTLCASHTSIKKKFHLMGDSSLSRQHQPPLGWLCCRVLYFSGVDPSSCPGMKALCPLGHRAFREGGGSSPQDIIRVCPSRLWSTCPGLGETMTNTMKSWSQDIYALL